MSTQPEIYSNTSSIGNVITLPLLLLPLICSPSYQPTSHHSFLNLSSIQIQGTESTGNSYEPAINSQSYYNLSIFLEKFLANQVEVPQDFNQIFQDNFLDLLA